VPAEGPAETPPDSVGALKELASLHQAGSLTDAEFAAAKAKLLDLDGDALGDPA
jgi:hypothetical protein